MTRLEEQRRESAIGPASGRFLNFIPMNERGSKPRHLGVTEIRGPYYSITGKRYLRDVFESASDYIDSLKFAGGAFRLMPRDVVREIIEEAHRHDVLVSTGGFIEYVLARAPEMVNRYIEECRDIGFDIVELSCGFITIPTDDWLRLIEAVRKRGLRAKPEVGIQFGAGGTSTAETLESEGTQDPEWPIQQARRFLDEGAYMIMVESEGITESVRSWRTDVVSRFVNGLGIDKVMFEAADPHVFSWYVKNYGPEVNLFVDHGQIVQLEALRRGIWGDATLWGRVLTYPDYE